MSMPQHCPGCGNRCSLDSPSCSTGEAYLRSLRQAKKKKQAAAQAAPAVSAPPSGTPEPKQPIPAKAGGDQPAPAAAPRPTENKPTPKPRSSKTPRRPASGAVRKTKAQPAAAPEEVYASLSQEDKLAYQMRSLSRRMAQNQPREKSGQARILALLAQRGELTQRQLLALAGIRSSSLSELLGKLTAAGLVQREVCPTDHRTTVVSLTDQGSRKAAQSQAADSPDPFQALSPQEREQLLSLLEKLNQSQS